MAKSPGFWFFTGDWLKDPELRFCSIFARGLLVDLLCLCFESARRGYLSKPDGTARSDIEIVTAVSGSTLEEKLAALSELESSGVLSRDENGVLFSRRIARLGEVSARRKQAGSKGGSKTQAKRKQNDDQAAEQKQGVSDSVSASDSVISHTHTQAGSHQTGGGRAEGFEEEWERWLRYRENVDGRRMDEIRQDEVLMELHRRGPEKARLDIKFSLLHGSKSILDSDNDFQKQQHSGGSQPIRKRVPSKQELGF